METQIKKRKDYFLYRIIKGLVRLFSPKMELTGTEHIPAGIHTSLRHPQLMEPAHFFAKDAGISDISLVAVSPIPEIENVTASEKILITR